MKAIILMALISLSYVQTSTSKRLSDREQAGFIGPVKKVFVEWTPVSQSRNGIQPGTRCRQLTSIYDETGRLIQNSLYPGSCGSDELRDTYTYDKEGHRITRTEEIRGQGSPPPPPPAMAPAAERESGPPRKTSKYNESGRLAETIVSRPSGKLVYKITYRYDAKGRLVESANYDDSGKATDRRVYTYDGDQRVPSSFTYYGRDGQVYIKAVYTEYEFNSHGDWIKRKESTEEIYNPKRTSLTFRNIEYYEGKK